jgi:cell division protein ZapA (FtsZ GTPase activity inhibitor)
MSDSERLVRFSLLGQDYRFYTGSSEEEMEEILTLVRGLIEENSSGEHGTIPVSKIAVMACLNIASKYIKLRGEFDDYRISSEERLHRVNEKIGVCLEKRK